MSRFITLSGQRISIDHIVMIFRQPANPMTVMATTVAGSPSIGVREAPEAIMKLIERIGAARDFIQVTSANLGVGKLRVNLRHVAAFGKNGANGSALVFGVAGLSPEPVRETPEELDALLPVFAKIIPLQDANS